MSAFLTDSCFYSFCSSYLRQGCAISDAIFNAWTCPVHVLAVCWSGGFRCASIQCHILPRNGCISKFTTRSDWFSLNPTQYRCPWKVKSGDSKKPLHRDFKTHCTQMWGHQASHLSKSLDETGSFNRIIFLAYVWYNSWKRKELRCFNGRLNLTLILWQSCAWAYTHFNELKQCGTEEWTKIPPQPCDRVMESCRKHFFQVIAAKGHWTGYQIIGYIKLCTGLHRVQ